MNEAYKLLADILAEADANRKALERRGALIDESPLVERIRILLAQQTATCQPLAGERAQAPRKHYSDVPNELADKALSARVPGGSAVRDWFFPHDTEKGAANVRDAMKCALLEALAHQSPSIDQKGRVPIAWLRFWAAQYSMGEGNIGTDEGLEVCSKGDVGMDGCPAFAVYANAEDDPRVRELIEAARPFTSGDIVDETSGTIHLMERLQSAIEEFDNE